MKIKAKTLSFVLIGFMLLAACAPQTPMPNTGGRQTPAATSAPSSQGSSIGGYADLLSALRAAGATVQSGSEVQQPFFPVKGQVIQVNGADVQVFEFSDDAARKQVSDMVSKDASTIGTSIPSWVDQPNVWAKGQLIVLYVGHDQSIIDTLDGVLGQPIAQGKAGSASLPPNVLQSGQEKLAAALNVATSQLKILEVAPAQWPNACLGLPHPGETCAQVVTPGWQAVADVAGQTYEIRTNEDGSVVRWQKLSGEQATPTPYDGNQGNMLPPALQAAQKQLLSQLGLAADQVQIQQVEPAQWPDACLGLPSPGETCAQVVTPGWKAIVDVAGQKYEVRANEDGSVVRWQKLSG